MRINLANQSDKAPVIEFCKNTFSWGDYISEVWDYWINEGTLLAAYQNHLPVAICHVLPILSVNQIWIEGIRVDPKFRRKGIGQSLILEAEKLGKQKNCKHSFMLIASTNTNSLSLAKKLNYKIFETWAFFSLTPNKNDKNIPIQYTKSPKKITDYLGEKNLFFVKSWRWIPLNQFSMPALLKNKKIIFSNEQKTKVLAVITDSEHFSSTMLITLLEGSELGINEFLKFIQNYGFEHNYKRLQILTKQKTLPELVGLDKKIIFYLMRKKFRPD